jgi:hypothetical protein
MLALSRTAPPLRLVGLAALAAAFAVGTPAQQPPANHWAFAAPVKQVPPIDDAWCRDDIDRCVLAGLRAANLQPSRDADRAVLLRRVHLVLTGLPPTPAEVEAFAADEAADAYERVVDALLSRDACAEHLATDWLDLARFADTYGFQSDFECRTWPWRDWLLRALAADMPQDQFVRELVAGDLLPDATTSTRIATAFWRLHRQTNEGGSIDEEWRHEYIADRVDTFGTTFLGLTVGCARCHDHKSDPISQRDYYSLGSFFAIDEEGLYPYTTGAVPQPALRLATREQDVQTERLRAAVSGAEKQLREARAGATSIQRPNVPIVVAAPVAHRDFGDAGHVCDGDARLPIASPPAFTRDDAFSVRLVLWCPDTKERAVLLHTSAYTEDADTQGYQLLLKDGHLCWEVVHHWPGSAAAVRTVAKLPLQREVDVVATYDGSSDARGLAIFVNGERADVAIVRNHLAGPATVRVLELGGRDRDRGFTNGRFRTFALYDFELTAAEVATLAARDPAPAAQLDHFAVRTADAATERALVAARKALHAHVEAIPELMAMAPHAHEPERFVLRRGAYDQPDRAKRVQPDVPAAVLPFAATSRDRLGLANWLNDARHPLAARVAVDRLWATCFGRGLVATPENFGVNGTGPAQQVLLDMLAVDFQRERSTKRLLRRIVCSATFRQSSAATPEQREADPHNERLGRGPSFRLAAEVLRDQALAASGLLQPRFGGPSVKPWQPPGLWRDAGVGWGGADYEPDSGADAHRRSLYTFRKRTAPPPNMTTLDGTSREVCVARRQSTDTPLQTLVMLGDPVFTECAAALARRALALPNVSLDEQLQFAFVSLATRAPRDAELAALRTLHATVPDAVQAMTLVASTLMASDAAMVLR